MTAPTASPSACAYPWMPDAGDGTYRNPVIHADYSDPDIIRHGDDFWLTASSFNCTPGLPILHSRDLVNWSLVNHAIRQVPHPRYAEVLPGCGVWAPALRWHAGKFWIFFPLPDEGIYVTTATDLRGAWSEPWLLAEARGWIDPCPFWDDDGQAYLVHAFANSRAGKKERIQVRPMAPDGRSLLGEGREIIHAPHHPFLEGPKVHKIDGRYYILCPGGGVSSGWQVVFRADTLWGPYDEKIVLAQGGTAVNGPHQGALIDLTDARRSDGEWWFMHFQDAGAFGRINHLQPVSWRDGWPCFGFDREGRGTGEPVAGGRIPRPGRTPQVLVPATTDEFDDPTLGRPWQWHANHDPAWASPAARPGWLRLTARPAPNGQVHLAPHFLGQKFPARSFAVATRIDGSALEPGDLAGLAVVGGPNHALLGLRRTDGAYEVVWLEPGRPRTVAATHSPQLEVQVEVTADAVCHFTFTVPPQPDWREGGVHSATAGGWIGAKIGLVALAGRPGSTGRGDFDYFRFR
ncbi:MAG: glycoside hydrolase 43 family protein [Opitutales bacterium]